MKKYFFLLLLSLPLSYVFAQKTEKELYLNKSLSGESIKNVQASTSGGSIVVEGVASNPRVEVYISPNNYPSSATKEELRQRFEELYTLDVSVTNNKLNAIAKPKDKITDWERAVNVAFKIYVPQDVSTDLNTSGGSISLTNLSGIQKFSTSGGSLSLDKLSGKIDGRTSGGSIDLKNSKDEIELSTSGGSIDAQNCSGTMKLTTSGGSLHFENLKGTIHATTSGGSVDGENIEGELITHTSGGGIHLSGLSCSLETSTGGGNIDVSIKQLGKYVKINNSAGAINLTLPKNAAVNLDLSGRMDKISFQNFDGKIDDNEVKGKLNGGGIPVTADAGWGKISIAFK